MNSDLIVRAFKGSPSVVAAHLSQYLEEQGTAPGFIHNLEVLPDLHAVCGVMTDCTVIIQHYPSRPEAIARCEVVAVVRESHHEIAMGIAAERNKRRTKKEFHFGKTVALSHSFAWIGIFTK